MVRLIWRVKGTEIGHGKTMELRSPAGLATERVLAALLLEDSAGLQDRFSEALRFNDFAEELVWQTNLSGLSGLFYERVCELGANDLFADVGLPDGRNSFRFLESEAKQQAIKAFQFDERFFELRKLLENELSDLIWLKSTVLARTLYTKLNYRVGIDYDVLVNEERLPDVLERLNQAGWMPMLDDPGYCHQLGVGPANKLADLFLVPQNELEGCHNLTMQAPGWPYLELKFNPLDNGVKMKELDRFFSQTVDVQWRGGTFKSPGLIDHLLIELTHLHKHNLHGLGWMHDIHLLCNELNKDQSQWLELARRARKEGIEQSVRNALVRVCGVLDTNVPPDIMDMLGSGGTLTRPMVNCVSTEFIWNANSLPMLVLNACVLGDGKRKMRILKESFFPDDQFLSKYYLDGKPLGDWDRLKCQLMHWLVLVLPAGVVRQSFGKKYWPMPNQELVIDV